MNYFIFVALFSVWKHLKMLEKLTQVIFFLLKNIKGFNKL